jgi:hypothetical protein
MSDNKQRPLNEGRIPQNAPRQITGDQPRRILNGRAPAETPRPTPTAPKPKSK